MIKDSGSRTEYETGAVRDIQEGKGRCDLMPLDVVAEIGDCWEPWQRDILHMLDNFQNTSKISYLYDCITTFGSHTFPDPETLLLDISIHFKEGASKYGEGNWKKGIPESSYVDSAVRHFLKWLRNDEDERHDRAFIWNIMCLIWTHEHATCKMPAWIDGTPTAKLEKHGKCVETSCYYNNDCTCTAPPAALVDETAGKECPQYSDD